MKIYHCDENILLWWKFIAVMKIYYSDKNSLLWSEFIAVMINKLKVYHVEMKQVMEQTFIKDWREKIRFW